MWKKQSNAIKKRASDNKVSGKFWNFEMVSFYVLPGKKSYFSRKMLRVI